MSTKNNIRKALKSIMSEGEASVCAIDKGYHYNGSTEESGWYYRPFNREPVTLGKNESEALEMIEQIRESRE
jgi:hypothetical protein